MRKNSYSSFLTRVLFVMLACPAAGMAASFSCSKASSATEKIICSDAELSRMDESLNSAYKEVLKAAAAPDVLRADQRKWVADVRDKCRDAVCLSKVYQSRITELKDSSKKTASKCEVDEHQIVGSWNRIKGGDFEEFAFVVDNGKHSFISWLHHQPEFVGTWGLENCTLSIKNYQNQALDFEYEVLKVRDKVMYLQSTEDSKVSSYKKIKDH